MTPAWRRLVAAAAVWLVAAPALAQTSKKPPKGKPPSSTTLPDSVSAGLSAAGISVPPGTGSPAGAPTAWIDEASLLTPGSAAVAVYVSSWNGANASQLQAPVLDASVGVAPRLQIGANVPHIVASADGSQAGGLGTAFFSAKIGVTGSDAPVKMAVAPTVQLLGDTVLASMPTDTNRVRVGVPVIVEVDRGTGRVFASAGYFTPGTWFTGVGVGVQPASRFALTMSFSRAWTTDDAVTTAVLPARDRNEITAGASYGLGSQFALFGSVARTIATADEAGAGVTIAGGISIFALQPGR